ncbi:hypothetical protein [Streptomyces sp. NPDC051136]|uniref:hypothetical protein n=1 Tax=Streptomyces sp. NPDC051136 TaxID=3365643 RepID=UPI00379BF94D
MRLDWVALRGGTSPAGRPCLDVREQADVIVVQPSSEGRAAGGRPVWLGLVNDPEATEDIAGWVQAGGPGGVPLPDILDLYTITPPRRG